MQGHFSKAAILHKSVNIAAVYMLIRERVNTFQVKYVRA